MIKRKRFTEIKIRPYGATTNIWQNKFDSPEEFFELGTCFACGFDHGALEKAHIHALWEGGEDEVSNIHMLCKRCHHVSENFKAELYWQWFKSRSIVDIWCTQLAETNCLSPILKNQNDLPEYAQTLMKMIHNDKGSSQTRNYLKELNGPCKDQN